MSLVIDGVNERVLSVCIFNIVDKRIKFYSHNTNLFPPILNLNLPLDI